MTRHVHPGRQLSRRYSHRRNVLRPVRATPSTLCLALLLGGCQIDLGPRDTQDGGSFGQIVYRETCQRVTFTGDLQKHQQDPTYPIDVSGVSYIPFCDDNGAPPPGAPIITNTLTAEEPAIVAGVDTAFPAPLLDPLDGYLQAILPLQDDGTLTAVVNSSSTLLGGLSASGPVTGSLYHLGWRDGFRPRTLAAGLPRAVLADPNLNQSLTGLLPILSPSTPGKSDAAGRTQILALFSALHNELQSTQPLANPADPQRTLALALDFLFTNNPALATLPAGQGYPGVLRDYRGVAQLNFTGAVPSPYLDLNHDGLPDVDPAGHFLGTGGPLADITPFPSIDPSKTDHAIARDGLGQALLSAGGATLYKYQNLDQTLLAGLLRDGAALMDPDSNIPLPLLRGAGLLMGPRGGGGFVGDQAPLLDLIYSFVQLLGYTSTGDTSGADMRRLLEAAATLLRQSEPQVSRNLSALSQAFDLAKEPQYAAAQLPDTVTLYDDLAPMLVRVLRVPGLVDDLVAALQDPAVADLPALVSGLANESGYFYMNQDQFDYTQPGAVIGTPGKPVLRGATDVDSDVDKITTNVKNNRSVLQRTLHLVHDANNLKFCNKANTQLDLSLLGLSFKLDYAAPCSLYEIDDLALFYILSIASQAEKSNSATFAYQVAYFPNAIKATGFLDFLLNVANVFGLGDTVFQNLTGINGFGDYPAPQASARMLFMDPSNPMRSPFLNESIDPDPCAASGQPQIAGTLCCNQNHSWGADHDGILFALEVIHPPGKPDVTFYTAFQPIVNAFAKHAECADDTCSAQRNAAKILVDIMAVLHRHWPTAASTFFGLPYEPQNQHSGVVHYEPVIADVLTQTDLFPALQALSVPLGTLTVDDGSGVKVLTAVEGFLSSFFDPAAPRVGKMPLVYRNGATMSLRNDGQPSFHNSSDPYIVDVLPTSLAGIVTPYYLVADAFKAKRAALGTDMALWSDWKNAVSNTANLYLLATNKSGTYHFQNPRFVPVSLGAVNFLQSRLSAHATTGDLDAWVRTDLVADLRGSLTGAVFAATADLATPLAANDGARRSLQALLANLLDPTQAPTFQSVVTTSADFLQLLLDDGDVVPLLNGLSSAFDPNASGGAAADAALGLVRRGQARDPGQVLLTILRNLYTGDPQTGLYPLFRLTDAVAEIDRSAAGQPSVVGTDLSQADYAALLGTTAQFLADHQRGLSRFLDIVATRNGN